VPPLRFASQVKHEEPPPREQLLVIERTSPHTQAASRRVNGLKRVQEGQHRPLNVEWVRIAAQAGRETSREFHATTPVDVYREVREIQDMTS
jgi:hypothetical protein